MKNSEIARYWAAKELTSITRGENSVQMQAPFACPGFTLRVIDIAGGPQSKVQLSTAESVPLTRVERALDLVPGTCWWDGNDLVACLIHLPKGKVTLSWGN